MWLLIFIIFISMEWLIKPKHNTIFEGEYNFHLVINDQVVDSSSTVSITVFSDRSQQAVVPCNYSWFLIKNEVPHEVPEFKGSSFICQTSHIGYNLQAHIISNDAQYAGKAIVTFGTIELDIGLKTEIMNILSRGYSTLPVFMVGSEQQQKQCSIQVYQEKIKIMHTFSNLQYVFDYSLLEPLFTHHPKEINHLTILFSQIYEKELRIFERSMFSRDEHSITRSSIKQSSSNDRPHNKLQIRFLSRSHRDIFLYAIKAFIAKRELKNSAIIRKIQKATFQTNEQFGAILLINELRRELARYDKAYKNLVNDRKKLEQSLQMSMFGNKHEANLKTATTTARREDPILLKYLQMERQNQALNNRISVLVQEINQIKQNTTVVINQHRVNFNKKKQLPEENTITYLLEDLSRSEQMLHFDAENQLAIDRLTSQKRALQMKLEQAHQKIANLQRNQKSTYGFISVEKAVFDRLRAQGEDLKRVKDRKERELKQSKELIQQLKKQNMQRAQSTQFKSSDAQHLHRELEDLRSQLAISEGQLDQQTKLKETFEDKYIHLSRKHSELQSEIEMYRRNQDVLNRSQALSEQMEDYNEEQIKILKEQNSFLVNENQKMAKACEKYMAEAKQAIKLRHEILQLKEKLNAVHTNPENSSFV